MVQPFGLIHRAGLMGPLPSQHPPSYSCRSGLSILMPVLDRPAPDAMPVKMQVGDSKDAGYSVPCRSVYTGMVVIKCTQGFCP